MVVITGHYANLMRSIKLIHGQEDMKTYLFCLYWDTTEWHTDG